MCWCTETQVSVSCCQRETYDATFGLFLLSYNSFSLWAGWKLLYEKERKQEKERELESWNPASVSASVLRNNPTFVSLPVWVFLLLAASFLSDTRILWVMCTAAGVELWSFTSRVGVSVDASEDNPLSSSSILSPISCEVLPLVGLHGVLQSRPQRVIICF